MVSAVVALPAGAALRQAGLVVYDSSIAESRAFARLAGMARRIDLAVEHRTRFATLRAGLPKGKAIEGLTRWSDWVGLRGELESQGWRMIAEIRDGALIRWAMKRA